VQAIRDFLGRSVRLLAGGLGVRQFLDLGTGIPNENNVHGVAQATDPASRIVYVDYDPIVLAHAHALLASTPEGRTDFVQADLREPEVILEKAARTLEPGLVPIDEWRPDVPPPDVYPPGVQKPPSYGGLARKP
jgi:S-adenosyl methyltransferase